MMLEIVFASVLIISCVGFLLFLFRISGTTKPRKRKRKKTKTKHKEDMVMGFHNVIKSKQKEKTKSKLKEVDGVEIPEEWQTDNPHPRATPKPSPFSPSRSHKIRVPGLLTMKRVIAGFLLIFNFFIAQATLTSAPATQPLYILFILNAFILIDYLWKTRRRETL